MLIRFTKVRLIHESVEVVAKCGRKKSPEALVCMREAASATCWLPGLLAEPALVWWPALAWLTQGLTQRVAKHAGCGRMRMFFLDAPARPPASPCTCEKSEHTATKIHLKTKKRREAIEGPP